MSECTFCGIDDKEKLYKDDKCYVVLDKYPAAEGHLLIVSNGHYKNMMETPDPIMEHMFVVTKKQYKILWEKLSPVGGSVVTNTGPGHVDHFHIHIIPRYNHSKSVTLQRHDLTPEKAKELKEKLGF